MLDLIRDLAIENEAKIVLLVADGLGGLPMEPGGPTELEAASTPHLDALVAANVCGLSIPVAPGITPGSGPGHLGLFGYDPLRYSIGRGVLEALGIDFDLRPADVAARGNFCTVGPDGAITDRRAGRISTDVCRRLVEKLRSIRLDGVELFLEPVRDYRFVLVLRGDGLEARGRRHRSRTHRRAAARARGPQSGLRAHGGTAPRLHRAGRGDPGGRASRQHAHAPGHRPPAADACDSTRSTSCAPPRSPCTRCIAGLARLVGMTILPAGGNWAEQVDAAARELARLRLLLPALQVHRCRRRGRRLRAQGRVHRGVRRSDRPT